MGGPGSGFYYRFGSKGRAEDHLSADVRRWHRRGLLEPGTSFTASWGRIQGDSSIGVLVLGMPGEPADAVRLSYSQGITGEEKKDVAYRVPLDWTSCNFGGARPWFVCPGMRCGRRAALLYLGGRYFLCRGCQDLSYASQRERGGSVPALHRCQRIRRKLGGSPSMSEPFPEKPKGMHWKTYWRLHDQHDVAWTEYLVALSLELAMMGDRLNAILGRGS